MAYQRFIASKNFRKSFDRFCKNFVIIIILSIPLIGTYEQGLERKEDRQPILIKKDAVKESSNVLWILFWYDIVGFDLFLKCSILFLRLITLYTYEIWIFSYLLYHISLGCILTNPYRLSRWLLISCQKINSTKNLSW